MATPNETLNVTFDQPIPFPLRGPYDYILMTAPNGDVHRVYLKEDEGHIVLIPSQDPEE